MRATSNTNARKTHQGDTMTTTSSFKNQPLADFSSAEVRRSLAQALEAFDQKIQAQDLSAMPIISGVSESGREKVLRTDPSDRRITIGTTSFASVEQASRAVAVCAKGLAAWRSQPYAERARIIEQLGLLIKDRALFFTSLLIREAGKPWREADADVAEAIDFCLYYAAEMRRLGPPLLTEQVLGEENLYLYQPRGVVAVISPWNFPLAIACGMTAAALVTGNTVVFKPAEQTSIVGHELAKLVLQAGVPADCFAFLPGRGEEVGKALVENPAVSMVAFTGSRDVGLEIIASTATVKPGQNGIKRVVAELGGKNAIIIDDDADFDDAIRGVLSSAFGYAGQKCSACSRVIVVGAAYEPFLARLAAATADIVVGPSSDPASFLGPIIDEESFLRISSVIDGVSDVPLLVRGTIPETARQPGWFIPPTIYRDVPASHLLWRNELFAPIVACAQAQTFEQALEMAVDSDYALTGGVFSRNPEHIELARAEFRVGNLYINRGITGALVGRQPFGGFKLSGIGSKAGGRDYLLQFMEPRTITENTMRRGFTPDIDNP